MPKCEKCGVYQEKLLTKRIENDITEPCISIVPELEENKTIELCYKCFHRNKILSRLIVKYAIKLIKEDPILINFDEFKQDVLKYELSKTLARYL